MSFTVSLAQILELGYVLSFIFANVVVYLIANFYHKKFDQPAPTLGFVIAIVLAIPYGMAIFMRPTQASSVLEVFRLFFLFGSSAGATWSGLALYFTMTKIRK